MNPFEQVQSDFPAMTQPFRDSEVVYDRLYTVRESSEGRTADRSAKSVQETIGTVLGAEPQQVQRVTTNLISVDEGLAMQIGAFVIFIESTNLIIQKNNILVDNETFKRYRVLAPYQQGKKAKLMVIETDD